MLSHKWTQRRCQAALDLLNGPGGMQGLYEAFLDTDAIVYGLSRLSTAGQERFQYATRLSYGPIVDCVVGNRDCGVSRWFRRLWFSSQP